MQFVHRSYVHTLHQRIVLIVVALDIAGQRTVPRGDRVEGLECADLGNIGGDGELSRGCGEGYETFVGRDGGGDGGALSKGAECGFNVVLDAGDVGGGLWGG
jgi:hypothetical protein